MRKINFLLLLGLLVFLEPFIGLPSPAKGIFYFCVGLLILLFSYAAKKELGRLKGRPPKSDAALYEDSIASSAR